MRPIAQSWNLGCKGETCLPAGHHVLFCTLGIVPKLPAVFAVSPSHAAVLSPQGVNSYWRAHGTRLQWGNLPLSTRGCPENSFPVSSVSCPWDLVLFLCLMSRVLPVHAGTLNQKSICEDFFNFWRQMLQNGSKDGVGIVRGAWRDPGQAKLGIPAADSRVGRLADIRTARSSCHLRWGHGLPAGVRCGYAFGDAMRCGDAVPKRTPGW